ncbi:nuclear transport factor 2 family protein [Granulosicoccus antarcticus]|uniref:SnoaL-like domain-containing protein n=1 Tax=Granulosicoccus antarcticus IMCC3135 TaxID=1192854 RepID=A0A2Z2P0Y3_9GAMM|nr:nuclear transport factor 2 family protein [Granulosicoccus antarcticus]ASJ73937.1 hypothetical protein IMCC3135_19290 [Granulosicoccus antarcticus IMCC3135]
MNVASTAAESLVRDYLQAMEQRDLEKAQTFLANGFVMTFPGTGEMTSLSTLVDWSRSRYRYVRKTLAAVNIAHEPDGFVVFVHGSLSGEWPDGNTFSDIRFIDRFEVRNNRLERQDVWNDLANALS